MGNRVVLCSILIFLQRKIDRKGMDYKIEFHDVYFRYPGTNLPSFQEHTFYALSIKEFVAHRLLNVMMAIE